MVTSALPAAVLLDMDGTLIDTEPLWFAAEAELTARFGVPWNVEDATALIGTAMPASAALFRSLGVDLPAARIADDLTAHVAAGVARAVPWRPGARELIADLRAADVPTALVTSSYRTLADPFVAAAGGFDAVVAGDDVLRAKPDPEPYLRAADLLGLEVDRCVAIEDSRAGVASALASGARTIVVRGLQEVADAPGLSRVDSLLAVDRDLLASVAAGRRVRV